MSWTHALLLLLSAQLAHDHSLNQLDADVFLDVTSTNLHHITATIFPAGMRIMQFE